MIRFPRRPLPAALLATLAALSLSLAPVSTQAQAGTRYQAQWLEYSKGWSSSVADYNGDGHDDVWNNGHDRDDRIWFWTPTGYQPGPQVMPYVDRHACAAADFNRDHLLDFYCAVGAEKGTGAKLNELWLQDATGTFKRAVNFGAEDVYGRGRYPVWLDVNHDGWPDLYLTNESTDREDGQVNINHLFINQGGRSFVEQPSVVTGKRGYQCAGKGDIDGDGWDDLLVCGWAEGNHLFLNNHQGDFVELATPATASGWNDAKLVDMNGDGHDDLLVLTQHRFQVWLNTGPGSYFRSPSFDMVLSSTAVSMTVGDFDGNGRKDVYVVLQDPDCTTSLVDRAPDVVFWGQADGTYVMQAQPQVDLPGCGHRADTVDGDKVMLEQGGTGYKGGTYVIRWK